jgi:hypothetical protein
MRIADVLGTDPGATLPSRYPLEMKGDDCSHAHLIAYVFSEGSDSAIERKLRAWRARRPRSWLDGHIQRPEVPRAETILTEGPRWDTL